MPDEPPQVFTRSLTPLWRNSDFVKLWTGRTVSHLGSALTRLGMPLIAASTLQASTAQMGYLTALESAPYLVMGLFAGVLADRFSRRSLMITADVGRAVFFALIPIAALTGWLSIPLLYVVTFLAGVLTVVFEIGSQSYIPDLIDHSQLVEANSGLELSGSITAVAGPSLAGVIIDAVTAPFAILLDAFTFLFSGACIVLIGHREEKPRPSTEPLLRQVRDGLAWTVKDARLRAFAGCMAVSNLASTAFFALYILFGTRELHLTAGQLGLVYGIGAAGSMLAAFTAPRMTARWGVGRTLLIGALLGSAEVLPAVFAMPENAVVLLILSSLLGNIGWVVYNINAISVRQAIVPPSMIGRVNATMGFITAGMLPVGALLGGLLGEAFGLRSTIALAAIGSLLSALWIIFSPVPRMQTIAKTDE